MPKDNSTSSQNSSEVLADAQQAITENTGLSASLSTMMEIPHFPQNFLKYLSFKDITNLAMTNKELAKNLFLLEQFPPSLIIKLILETDISDMHKFVALYQKSSGYKQLEAKTNKTPTELLLWALVTDNINKLPIKDIVNLVMANKVFFKNLLSLDLFPPNFVIKLILAAESSSIHDFITYYKKTAGYKQLEAKTNKTPIELLLWTLVTDNINELPIADIKNLDLAKINPDFVPALTEDELTCLQKQVAAIVSALEKDFIKLKEILTIPETTLERKPLYGNLSGTIFLPLKRNSLSMDTRSRAAKMRVISPKGSGIDLSHAILRGFNLSSSNLRGANLSGADLTNTKLNGADLSSTDLTNADLTNADLKDAFLIHADLTNTDLTNANLSGVVFKNANLGGTKLTLEQQCELLANKQISFSQILQNKTFGLTIDIQAALRRKYENKKIDINEALQLLQEMKEKELKESNNLDTQQVFLINILYAYTDLGMRVKDYKNDANPTLQAQAKQAEQQIGNFLKNHNELFVQLISNASAIDAASIANFNADLKNLQNELLKPQSSGSTLTSGAAFFGTGAATVPKKELLSDLQQSIYNFTEIFNEKVNNSQMQLLDINSQMQLLDINSQMQLLDINSQMQALDISESEPSTPSLPVPRR